MKIFYDQCMDVDEHERLGDEPLESVLAELGGWPVVEESKWVAENFSLEETLINMKRIGYKHDFFATIEIAPHVLAHKYNLIYVSRNFYSTLYFRSLWERESLMLSTVKLIINETQVLRCL